MSELKFIKNVSHELLFEFKGKTIDVECSGDFGIGHQGDNILIFGKKGETLLVVDLEKVFEYNDKFYVKFNSIGDITIIQLEQDEQIEQDE